MRSRKAQNAGDPARDTMFSTDDFAATGQNDATLLPVKTRHGIIQRREFLAEHTLIQ